MNHVVTSADRPREPGHAPIWAGIAAWLGLSLALSVSGVISFERRFLVPVLILGIAASLVIAARRSDHLRAFVRTVDLRIPILFHALRAPIGAGFLWMASQGRLDPEFARIAGWGDLVAGFGALAAAACVPMTSASRRRFVLAWNAVGLVDITLVILTAQRILILSDHPGTMRALLTFPGPLLPTFIVPLVVATHVLVFARQSAPSAA